MLNPRILIILLVSIGLDEAYNSAILESSAFQSQLTKALISLALYGSSIIFSPIQAGFSDFSSRKNGLIFAFVFTLFAISGLFFSFLPSYFLFFLLSAAILKGAAGNIVPIARAALADSIQQNFRFAIGLSTSAIAAGYIFIKILSTSVNSFYVPLILIFTIPVVLFFIIRFFFDKHDQEASDKPRSFLGAMLADLKSLYYDFIKDKIFFLSLSAYFFWEVSFYLIFIKDVELESEDFKNFSITMCIGYLVGVMLLRTIKKWHDQHVLKLGHKVSILSYLSIFAASFLGIPFFSKFASVFGFFVYSLGFGFFVPCLFSMVSKIRLPHEQGKIYGLIDSVDTVAFAAALLIGVFLTKFSFIVFISFIFLLIGIFIYNISQKHWLKHAEKIKN